MCKWIRPSTPSSGSKAFWGCPIWSSFFLLRISVPKWTPPQHSAREITVLFASDGTLLPNISSKNFQGPVTLIYQKSSYPGLPSARTAGSRLHDRCFSSSLVRPVPNKNQSQKLPHICFPFLTPCLKSMYLHKNFKAVDCIKASYRLFESASSTMGEGIRFGLHIVSCVQPFSLQVRGVFPILPEPFHG